MRTVTHSYLLFAFLGCRAPAPAVHPSPGLDVIDETPRLVAPGTISTGLNERDTALAPDGSLLFTVWSQSTGTLVMSRAVNGGYEAPVVLSFSGEASDLEPAFDPSGERLFFVSNRPLPGTERTDYNIWVVPVVDGGFGAPEPIAGAVNTEADEFYPSLTRDGTLYFTAVYESGMGRDDLYRAVRAEDGTYPTVEQLQEPVNSDQWEFNAFIDPDERFLLFTTARRFEGPGRGDLVVSHRSADGSWSAPVLLPVNSKALDYCPFVSPDGSVLYFTSQQSAAAAEGRRSYRGLRRTANAPGNGEGDLYRVSASVIPTP